jgi:hypothetical protein
LFEQQQAGDDHGIRLFETSLLAKALTDAKGHGLTDAIPRGRVLDLDRLGTGALVLRRHKPGRCIDDGLAIRTRGLVMVSHLKLDLPIAEEQLREQSFRSWRESLCQVERDTQIPAALRKLLRAITRDRALPLIEKLLPDSPPFEIFAAKQQSLFGLTTKTFQLLGDLMERNEVLTGDVVIAIVVRNLAADRRRLQFDLIWLSTRHHAVDLFRRFHVVAGTQEANRLDQRIIQSHNVNKS